MKAVVKGLSSRVLNTKLTTAASVTTWSLRVETFEENGIKNFASIWMAIYSQLVIDLCLIVIELEAPLI